MIWLIGLGGLGVVSALGIKVLAVLGLLDALADEFREG